MGERWFGTKKIPLWIQRKSVRYNMNEYRTTREHDKMVPPL